MSQYLLTLAINQHFFYYNRGIAPGPVPLAVQEFRAVAAKVLALPFPEKTSAKLTN